MISVNSSMSRVLTRRVRSARCPGCGAPFGHTLICCRIFPCSRRLAAIEPWLEEQQEERLQALIDSSPLALVEFGLDTRIRLWNPAAERIFGWSREEMLGRGGLPMAPPSKRAESEQLFEKVRAGEWINDYETVRQHKDGTLVAVSIAAAPVRDASGQVVGNMVAYTDITERKAAGGGGPSSERRASRPARGARRVASPDRHRR